ncbi:ParB/RepB/Spo0J family partition protein, partial [Candidatus Saccharibacteria bacterium]|nr:ParB/RepB/Spo0J family partition protein [Candidatus Saccharibacteria bacterium]
MSAKKPTGLGKGIDALISSNFDRSILTDENERVQNLFISDIFPNDEQPRKHFDEKGLNELASSIKQYGVLQPLIVVAKNKGYEIIAGERRWRAAQIAN